MFSYVIYSFFKVENISALSHSYTPKSAFLLPTDNSVYS